MYFNFVSKTCTFASTFKEDNGDQKLNCKTKKDRGVRLNKRTAGVHIPRLKI